ncbi:MAG: hypothetical protein BSR46_03680 [Candidatus Dactylopiibacterium carminicum]|nr:MAG: hypothetical protein BSR46_03680 [Candidatus Dactylopiibacterium carminicum]
MGKTRGAALLATKPEVREQILSDPELSLEAMEATFGDIEAFVDLSAEQYGTTLRGVAGKGNLSLLTFDGRYKVQRAISESITFDERLLAAKALIDEFINDLTSKPGVPSDLKVLVNDAFQVDKSGNLSVGRVLGLRRFDISDPRWLSAMKAIGESVQVIGSKSYLRVYERVGDTDQFRAIPLDVAGV